MQQGSENAKGQDAQTIHQFIEGLVDERKKEYKLIKATNLSCQEMIETRISDNPDVKRLLFKYQDDLWIKQILVSYILLQIYHNTTLWVVEDSQSISKKNKGIQYGRHDY